MVAVGVAVGVALALLGCGATPAQQQIDAGETIQKCAAAPICDGLRVLECRNGAVGGVIDDCAAAGACSNGRCMSPACAAVDRLPTSALAGASVLGCVFYTAEADNAASDASAATSFLIANPGAEAATVTLEGLGAGGMWSPKDTTTVPASGAARLSIAGREVVLPGVNAAYGLRLLSTRPVTVAQVESDDRDQSALSSGGTMLLPTHVLGPHYLVMTYGQAATGTAVSALGAPDGAGRLLIVGTEPRTTVNITLPAAASMAITGLNVKDKSVPFQFMLGDGDVFQAWTSAEGEDLSGADINADQPIAVFSGNIVTTYGKSAPGVHSPDMAHEQMPPIPSWSTKYVAAALPPQAGTCDTLIGRPGASIWRLLAATNQTLVTFTFPDGVTTLDPVPLDAGEATEIVTTSDFYVESSGTGAGPLLMTQGMDCEPSLSLAVSVDKFLDDLTFAVLPWFDQMAVVVRKASDPSDPTHLSVPLLLDGSPIPDTQFTSAGGGSEIARVTVASCPPSKQVCAHRLQGAFGVTMRGMDVLSSYALTVPTWVNCHDVDINCPN